DRGRSNKTHERGQPYAEPLSSPGSLTPLLRIHAQLSDDTGPIMVHRALIERPVRLPSSQWGSARHYAGVAPGSILSCRSSPLECKLVSGFLIGAHRSLCLGGRCSARLGGGCGGSKRFGLRQHALLTLEISRKVAAPPRSTRKGALQRALAGHRGLLLGFRQ